MESPMIATEDVHWAELAVEHWSRVASLLGVPCEICSSEIVCRSWRSALQDRTLVDEVWCQLCFVWFPTMAARIVQERSDAASLPEMTPQLSTMPSPSLPFLAASSPESQQLASPLAPLLGQKGCPQGFALLPEAAIPDAALGLPFACGYASSSLDATVSPTLSSTLAGPMCMDSGERAWREIFRMRFVKQQNWNVKKKGRRCVEPTLSTSEKDKRYVKLNMDAKEKKVAAKRLKTCKRCGVEYDPNEAGQETCKWHTGRFVAMDEDGVLVNTSMGGNRDFERRAHHLIKMNSRKKASKKANMIVFGASCDSGVAREDGVAWRWSCCAAESLVAAGCMSGRHT